MNRPAIMLRLRWSITVMAVGAIIAVGATATTITVGRTTRTTGIVNADIEPHHGAWAETPAPSLVTTEVTMKPVEAAAIVLVSLATLGITGCGRGHDRNQAEEHRDEHRDDHRCDRDRDPHCDDRPR